MQDRPLAFASYFLPGDALILPGDALVVPFFACATSLATADFS